MKRSPHKPSRSLQSLRPINHDALQNAIGASGWSFFDEADALFGKRTDVKDAHDRY